LRTASEHDELTTVISLGLLSSRLQFVLLRTKDSIPSSGDRTILSKWLDILDETINFIQSPKVYSIAGASGTASPRFLARSNYLAQLRSAAPASSSKTADSFSTYLIKIREIIGKFDQGSTLTSEQKRSLSNFVSTIAQSCVQEASKLQQEPHPEWPTKTALMPS
jgi:hypothetical protein